MPTDVDSANASAVGEQLLGVVDRDARCLVVDFRDTRYLDSAGIDMLLRLDERLRRRRKSLHVIVDEQSPLRRVLAIMAVDQALSIHGDVGEVVASSGG